MFERIMGLDVINHDLYQQYRENMTPILESYGGSFGYDFTIAETLRSKTDENINRVFTIEFPSEEIMDRFFSDADYLNVKAQYLDPSVAGKTVIAMHSIEQQR